MAQSSCVVVVYSQKSTIGLLFKKTTQTCRKSVDKRNSHLTKSPFGVKFSFSISSKSNSSFWVILCSEFQKKSVIQRRLQSKSFETFGIRNINILVICINIAIFFHFWSTMLPSVVYFKWFKTSPTFISRVCLKKDVSSSAFIWLKI